MTKYEGHGKQARIELFENNGEKFLIKKYGVGKNLTRDETETLLECHKKYIKNLNTLHLETNTPISEEVKNEKGEYVLVTVEHIRGEGFDMHEHLLLSENKNEFLSLTKSYYTLLVNELFLIPPFNKANYSINNQYVLVPIDFRPCNFVFEKLEKTYKPINIDTFTPRLWQNEGNLKYFSKLEDNFPAVKAKLLHLLMGNIRYIYGSLYGTILIISNQWGKEHLKTIEEIESFRLETAHIIYKIGKENLDKVKNIDSNFKNLLNSDIKNVLNKKNADSPYEGSHVIQNLWMKLDKGVLRDFK